MFAQAVAGLVASGLGSDAGVKSFAHTKATMAGWTRKSA